MFERAKDVSRNVLIACGTPSVLQTLNPGLTARHYKPTTAASGEQALELLRRHRFGTLIVESSVASIQPLQLVAAARRMHPQLVIIALLQPAGQGDAESALAAGASDICISPSSAVEMDAVIKRKVAAQAILANRLSSTRAEVLQKAIRAIASVVDSKMRFSGRHSANVTDMCTAMATEMGLSPDQIALVELAAQIHDIGMIAVPEDVVAKPERLDDMDWVDVLKHPALGSAMLSGVPELAEVAAAIRHHHERVDGQGYPDGLYGDAIPSLAKMISVADAYDAMTSERPHRPARSHMEAIKELRANAGAQFDPAYIELLVSVTDVKEHRKAA